MVRRRWKKNPTKKMVSKGSKGVSLNTEKINEFIRMRAYYIWEDMGKPQAKDVEIWDKAEKEILSQLKKR